MSARSGMSARSARSWRDLGFAGPVVFLALAVFEALVAPNAWLHVALYGVCSPASIANATGLYLDLKKRSHAATTLLVLAGVGSVVSQSTSAYLLPLLALIAIALLGAAVFGYAARRSVGAVSRNERGSLNRASI
jgi:hypothetical protein